MTKKSSAYMYSRQKARKIIKEYICNDLPSNIVVHHRDENPLNNDMSNLVILERGEHTRRHHKGKLKGTRESTLRKLDGLLVIFNDR
jgi:hypothetical protein